VEDLLFERGIDICHDTVRHWWNRFGPMFAGDIRRQRASRMRGFPHWRWHLDEMYVKLNGEIVYLWRAADQEGEILESYITKTRDKDAALGFMKKALKRHGAPEGITTDGLRSYRAAMKERGGSGNLQAVEEVGERAPEAAGYGFRRSDPGQRSSVHGRSGQWPCAGRGRRPASGPGQPIMPEPRAVWVT
jgi:putative transposase